MNSRGDIAVMVVCGLALVAAATVVQAQGLSDPTRPPATLESPAAGTAGAAPAPSGLQTIIHSNCGKPGAIVNGEYVTLGGRIGDARLVTIGEDSVTLVGSAGRETLKLMPGVEKKITAAGGSEKEKEWRCVKNPGNEVTR